MRILWKCTQLITWFLPTQPELPFEGFFGEINSSRTVYLCLNIIINSVTRGKLFADI